ncbi:MAG: hypothetical protein ACREO8_14480, partial [Luteimonas sp.]
VRIGEIDPRLQAFFQRTILGKFAASIARDRVDMAFDPSEPLKDAQGHLPGGAVRTPADPGKAAAAFDRRIRRW